MRILAASLAVLWLVPVTAAAQNVTPPAPTTATERCLRCNTNFLATFFTGLQIDSFAAEELRRYLNPEESGKILERMIAGFDFQYRMFGKPDDTGNNVWIYGETIPAPKPVRPRTTRVSVLAP